MVFLSGYKSLIYPQSSQVIPILIQTWMIRVLYYQERSRSSTMCWTIFFWVTQGMPSIVCCFFLVLIGPAWLYTFGRDSKGRASCFNYNLSECQEARAGGSCKRGRHVCFKTNSFKPQALSAAHADEMPKGNWLRGPDLSSLTTDDIIVSEILRGTAGVTASFNAIAVDRTKQAGVLAGVISFDLTSLANQLLVLQWLDHPSVHAVFLAPMSC